jgi:hypothetical protein
MKSGEGEPAAISGYHAQYLCGPEKIVDIGEAFLKP